MSDTEVSRFPCSSCKKSFSFKTNLRRHVKRVHKTSAEESGQSSASCASSSSNSSSSSSNSSSRSMSSASSPIDIYLAALKEFGSLSSNSEKSIGTLVTDAQFVINIARTAGIIDSDNKFDALFTVAGKMEHLVKEIAGQYKDRPSRGYSLLLAATKMVQHHQYNNDGLDESASSDSILTLKLLRVLDRARLPFANFRNKNVEINHNSKNLSNSERWLSEDDLRVLSRDLSTKLDDLDMKVSTSAADARR